MWDGRRDGLEDQVSGPISTQADMGGSLEKALATVNDVPAYRRAFKAVFGGDTVTFQVVEMISGIAGQTKSAGAECHHRGRTRR